MAVVKVATLDDFNEKISKENLTAVDFTAAWCGPCRMIGPKFDEMSQEYTDVQFLKVDVDDASEVAEKCGISCMPTFQFFKKGDKVHEFSGASEDKLRAAILSNK